MIKTLSIRNVGSNKSIDIKFDRHITCITGESYTGKSWILRAIKLLSLNKPSGTRYIKWDSKKAIVSVKVGKYVIKRERSKSINSYSVNNRKMYAFGNNVPDSVSKILNLSSLNFQIQQEIPYGEGPLFWFALTPGQVSKQLNKIVNLDLIDNILYNLGSEQHSAKSVLNICRERRKEAKQHVEELEFVENMKEEWTFVCDLIEKSNTCNERLSKLEKLIDSISEEQSTVRCMKQNMKRIEKDIQELEDLRKQIIYIEEQIQTLTEILSSIESSKKEIAQNRKVVKELEQEYEKLIGKRCPLCKRMIKS